MATTQTRVMIITIGYEDYACTIEEALNFLKATENLLPVNRKDYNNNIYRIDQDREEKLSAGRLNFTSAKFGILEEEEPEGILEEIIRRAAGAGNAPKGSAHAGSPASSAQPMPQAPEQGDTIASDDATDDCPF